MSTFNICRHGFTKSKFTVTDVAMNHDFIPPLVCSQCQAVAILILSEPVTALLLHKLADYGLCAGYINWFHTYLTNRLSCLLFQSSDIAF
jgi:hypothetical protein